MRNKESPDKDKDKETQKIISKWQNILRLGHWKISFIYKDSKEILGRLGFPAYAFIQYDRQNFRAVIYLDKNLKGKGFLEKAIVHELMHLITSDAHYFVKKVLLVFGAGGRKLVGGWWNDVEEALVDHLASVLCSQDTKNTQK